MSGNPAVALTLDDAVEEVLNSLTGLGLAYDPSYDRYRTIARMLNRALRANALEHDWSYYSETLTVGPVTAGQKTLAITGFKRARIVGDDAVRLVDADGAPLEWAYLLPRDALHKYAYQPGLWCSFTKGVLEFSRPFNTGEEGYSMQLTVLREPTLFEIPATPSDPAVELTDFDPAVRAQEVDFDYPDVIVARAAYLYSLTDPVMQPRAQTLEAGYKDLMYQLIERDDKNTDAPFQNEFFVPVQSDVYGATTARPYPVADRRRTGWE